MGSLLPFTPPAARRPRRRAEAQPDARIGGARILFFTGVRFERHAEPADTGSRPDVVPPAAGPADERLHRQA